MPRQLLRLGYAWLAVQGLLAAVAPRLSIDLNARLTLPCFENAGDLEPRDWYVRVTRVLGIGMAVAGAVGLLTEAGTGEESAPEPSDESVPVGDEGSGDETSGDGSSGDEAAESPA